MPIFSLFVHSSLRAAHLIPTPTAYLAINTTYLSITYLPHPIEKPYTDFIIVHITMAAACKALTLNPDAESAAYWGTESPCYDMHGHFDRETLCMNRVWWIHLGHDSQPRSCREWLAPRCQNVDTFHVHRAHWNTFLDTISVSEDEILKHDYVVKIPGRENTMPLADEFDWDCAMAALGEELALNHRLCCQNPPPVLIVCTTRQAKKYKAVKWLGAVKAEAECMVRLIFQESCLVWFG